MVFRKWLTKKATEAVETVAEPTKKVIQERVETVKKAVGDKSDWYTKVLRVLLAAGLVILTFRDDRTDSSGAQRLSGEIPNITINNYINKGGDMNDSKLETN